MKFLVLTLILILFTTGCTSVVLNQSSENTSEKVLVEEIQVENETTPASNVSIGMKINTEVIIT